MAFELVRNVIRNHYDYHDSKFLLGGAKQTGNEYYYNTAWCDWYLDFAKKNGEEMLWQEAHEWDVERSDIVLYPRGIGACTEAKYDMMLKCNTKLNNNRMYYSIEFYAINGVSLRKFRNKPALKLILRERSIFNIQINEDGELFWCNRKGRLHSLRFNWWLNRLLRENDSFRAFFVDLMYELANKYNRHILKDVARTIEKDEYFLPAISIDDICLCHNPDQLIRFLTGRDTPVNFNKWDINCAYYIMRLSEQIEEQDLNTLLQIPQEKLLSWIGTSDLFNGPQLRFFAANYYADDFEGDDSLIRRLATDYANMCISNNEKLSLRRSHPRSLEEFHDRQVAHMMRRVRASEFAEPLIPEDSRFRRLRELLPEEFTWIDSTKALFEEGERQHNCVYSYRDKLRMDITTIYHWDIEGRNYTIEFSKSGDSYSINQMLQKYNRPALPSDLEKVKNYIRVN